MRKLNLRPLAIVAAILLAVSACSGCQYLSNYTISTQDSAVVETCRVVVDRHDAYVVADPNLDPEEKGMFLADSNAVKAILAESEVVVADLETEMEWIMARHDDYVKADPKYDGDDEYLRDIILRDTKVLRGFFDAARAE